MSFQGEYTFYFKNSRTISFDLKEITKDDILDIIIGDEMYGLATLDLDTIDLSETSQTL